MSHFDNEPDPELQALMEERQRVQYRRAWNEIFHAFGESSQKVHNDKKIRLAAHLGDVDRRIDEYQGGQHE